MPPGATSYDEVPYHSNPIPQSHPDRLATVATLFGMKPPSLERCRVLELGCASGGNLLPMALLLPEGRFVGIDLSQRQIDMGQRHIEALELKNLQLQHRSILDVGPDFGEFDYLICHGVYSWVPAAVQDKILDICARNLAPDGVAYVSYNTYPGWHLHRMIRDVMRYHAARFAEPENRIRQARALVDFLASAVPQENNPYGILLRQDLAFLRERADWYVYHEFLEEVNEPVYFHQFAEQVAAQGLQYLGEADVASMVASNLTPQVEQVMRQLASDLIHLQQYLDFLRNTQFRQSLLCHGRIQLDRTRRPECMTAFHVASPAKPVSSRPDLLSTAPEQFRGPHGTLTTGEPMLKATMTCLAESWPGSVPFAALCAAARARLNPQAPPDANTVARDNQLLGASLLNGYTATRLIELHVQPVPCVVEVRERPIASPLARWQATASTRVTNLRHEAIDLDELSRHLLRFLDGHRDRSALLDSLTDLVTQGVLLVQHDGQMVKDASRVRGILNGTLDHHLQHLARSALLAG